MTAQPIAWRRRVNRIDARLQACSLEYRRLTDAGVHPRTARQLALTPTAVRAGARMARPRRAA